jgi:hypothetical protein
MGKCTRALILMDELLDYLELSVHGATLMN